MRKYLKIKVLFFSLLILTGCTTGIYTAPYPISGTPDTYEFKIDTTAFGGGTAANEHADKMIADLMQKHGYTSYKILHRNYTMVPMTGFVYQVQFFK